MASQDYSLFTPLEPLLTGRVGVSIYRDADTPHIEFIALHHARFVERTEATLIRPLFEDLVRLCVLPAAGGTAASGSSGDAGGSGSSGSGSGSLIAPPPYPGRFVRVREAGGLNEALAAGSTDTASDELQAHLAYVTFKKSGRKKYERKAGAVQERDTAVTK